MNWVWYLIILAMLFGLCMGIWRAQMERDPREPHRLTIKRQNAAYRRHMKDLEQEHQRNLKKHRRFNLIKPSQKAS